MSTKLTLVAVLLAPAGAGAADTPAQLFVTSDPCMACHNGLASADGTDISFGTDWRGSMMANAARDPYWQAGVRREMLARPTAAAAIQRECSKCHMPMSRYTSKRTRAEVFGHLPIVEKSTPADFLAADGVSCTVCHQIGSGNLGEQESFTAGFLIDGETALGERQLFGPYEVDPGRTALMQSAGLFRPTEASHVQSSELCATCHTLYTHSLDADGNVIGTFPEQVPYLEWRHSRYAGVESCQSCHMPEVEGEAPISSVLGVDRPNVSRHVFRGGNFFLPRILSHHRDVLGVDALSSELENVSRRTEEHLRSSAAAITVESALVSGGRLVADVAVAARTGHKLPTAYPSRRAWIHLVVSDAGGEVVFESGRFEPDGRIRGNDNDEDGGRYEPHRAEITSPDQVQIYEAILAGPDDRPTTLLLSAVRYVKDNRLLPDGFDKATADDDIAVAGGATDDADFVAGGDRIRYSVDVDEGDGPFTVQAQLWYQPIAYRWAHNLGDAPAMETERFVDYYGRHAGSSAVVLARHVAATRIAR